MSSSEVLFKKSSGVNRKRPRNVRVANDSQDDIDSNVESEKKLMSEPKNGDISTEEQSVLNKTMEIQKLRQKKLGLSHVTLASGVKLDAIQEKAFASHLAEDPFRVHEIQQNEFKRLPGLRTALTRQTAREVIEKKSDKKVSDLTAIGTQFSKETQIRDEDEEMRKFIGQEIEKRRNRDLKVNDSIDNSNTFKCVEDKALESLPIHLKKSTFQKNEEMLSNQMLSGIPEIDLGIEERIRNISETERARKEHERKEQQRKILFHVNRRGDHRDDVSTVNFRTNAGFNASSDGVGASVAATVKSSDRSVPTGTTITTDSSNNVKDEVTVKRFVKVGHDPVEIVQDEEEKRGSNKDSGNAVAKSSSSQGRGKGGQASDDVHINKFKKHFHRI